MKKYNAGIVGLGTYVPERILTNIELESSLETSDEWILSRTGIKERRIAAPEQAASDLALAAASAALENARVSASEVDLIICATLTPDMFFPATGCIVQDRLGAKKAAAFDLEAGCSGFIYGLSVAQAFIASGIYKTVLVIGTDVMSRIVNWRDRGTCVLFGDGAGAVVLKPVEQDQGILSVHLGADGSGAGTLLVPAGGSRMPLSQEVLDLNLQFIQMSGGDVFKFAVIAMCNATKHVLAGVGLETEDLGMLVPHQANTRIIESAAKRLKLPMDKVVVTVDRYGNNSTASVPLALKEAVDDGRIKNGQNVVLVGFGAGLTWGAVLIRWVL
ncbi:3-oxoacyl-(acyl-carrier-protein) synthase III [Desulfofarcimen acetoxidans DSM 771]|uniref:Beta-ketoacyl-[acyl-carrier-protein] synthase III n=1 Tax=Desulfofarcimen acetoxidans (strain ATCC 49208 / DSM 771 / KCTC 5769 / VKM B-1644 / 5575) TaxID=485916 RepID=C8W580_DESAS|nr:beta-ketoacyl-ACP synthase III [Desulfofarcimen acetoxidans]ACV62062.1 3-oxoacyl-(acyl-carrier-protein) synthase III [Desulfofarcimen acetoxidans DSM 771]